MHILEGSNDTQIVKLQVSMLIIPAQLGNGLRTQWPHIVFDGRCIRHIINFLE